MTPEQAKAKELVDKFKKYAHSHYHETTGTFDEESEFKNAKQCALIAVDEILKIVNRVLDAFGSESDGYNEKVKEEIIKLK